MLALSTKHVVPPGGFNFTDPGSGMRFPVDGGVIWDWNQLLQMVERHRSATGGDLDIGWELRVEHEFCCQNPNAGCQHHVPSKDLSIGLGDIKRFAHSILSFIKSGGGYVPQEEANRRAEICLQCPYQVADTLCHNCNGAAEYMNDKFFGERSTPYDDKLGNCGVCKCYNKLAVHWPLESQSTEGISKEDFPDHCWKKGA